MSVSSITSSLSSLLQQLQSQQNAASQSSQDGASQSEQSASSSQPDDPAYQMSLGRQQAAARIFGYSDLGKLFQQASKALSDIDESGLGTSVVDGADRPLAVSHRVEVRQLAQAQTLTSAGYADASATAVGNGTLTVQFGTMDPASGEFIDSGDPLTVSITDGTLDGIAATLNGAKAGLTASVAQGSDGQYRLAVTGPTGTARAFSMSGIGALSYDPSGVTASTMTQTQAARNARYSVDGGDLEGSPTNTVTIAGVKTTLTEPGTITVSAPFGQDQAVSAAQSLVDTVNTLLDSLTRMTATGGQLADDSGTASDLADKLIKVVQQEFPGLDGSTSLDDIGIAVDSDGTLTVDTDKLREAFNGDPQGTGALIAAATDATRQTLKSTGGTDGDIKSQLSYYTALLSSGPSLADILGQSAGGDPYSAFLGTDATNPLVALAQRDATAAGQDAEVQELLKRYGITTSGTAAATTASQAVSSYSAATSVNKLLTSA